MNVASAPTALIAHPFPIVVEALATIAARAGYTITRASDPAATEKGFAARPDLAIVAHDLAGDGAGTTLVLGEAEGSLPLTAPVDEIAARIGAVVVARRPAVGRALTPRERDVARLVAAGQRNRTIAVELGISEGTVKMHLHNVYAKLGLQSRTQLAMAARDLGAH